MDWKSDPQFRAIRQEFIESLPARKKQIEEAFACFQAEKDPARQAAHAHIIVGVAHKLAGTAGSYGLQDLTDKAALVEDHVGSKDFAGHVTELIAAICSVEFAPSAAKREPF